MKLEEGTEGPAAPDRFTCPVQPVHSHQNRVIVSFNNTF